jgi:hypothetical protein
MTHARLQALLPYLIRWVGEGVVTALKEGAQSEADGPGKRFMKVRANELHVHPSSQFKYMPISDCFPASASNCLAIWRQCYAPHSFTLPNQCVPASFGGVYHGHRLGLFNGYGHD